MMWARIWGFLWFLVQFTLDGFLQVFDWLCYIIDSGVMACTYTILVINRLQSGRKMKLKFLGSFLRREKGKILPNLAGSGQSTMDHAYFNTLELFTWRVALVE